MKRLKLFSIVALTTLVFGLTSCLNSNDSSSTTYQGVVEVKYNLGSLYFVTQSGTKIVPTTASLATVKSTYKFTADDGLAYIAYTKADDSSTSTSTSSTISATLTYAVSLKGTSALVDKGTEADKDSVSTVPIIELGTISTSSTKQISLFSTSQILIFPNYFISYSGSSLYANYFTLICYPQATGSTETNMDLYLRNRKPSGTSISTQYTSFTLTTSPSAYMKSFDISDFVSDFQEKTGKTPKTITIHYPQSSSTSISDAKEATVESDYSVTTE